MGQIIDLIRLFGLRKLIQMKRRHEAALPIFRGYVATNCFWALLNLGLLDLMRERGVVNLEEFAASNSLNLDILEGLCEYLDGLRILRRERGGYALDRQGSEFLNEPRGVFDLLYGYEPIFYELEALLRNKKLYKKDVDRRGKFIAKGSGELGRQLPFHVMQVLIKKYKARRILDIGCGDIEFLSLLCDDPDVVCYGIDNSQEAIRYAEENVRTKNLSSRIHLQVADMFVDLPRIAERWSNIDALTAIDTFHEYLFGGIERIVKLLKDIRALYRGKYLIVGEFCRQPQERLRRRPTAFLEHHLFHNLTNQVIKSEAEWEALFRESGYELLEKRVFDIVGHGYFVLK